jgi:FkbM family methyltransferase
MADSKRRDFLKLHVGAGTAFAAGVVGGAVVATKGDIVRAWRAPQPLLPPFAGYHYAQHAEDVILWDLVSAWLKINPATYLDVGAYHPVRSSNTYLFYERNCQGVLVEPNPALWEILAKVRPRDVLIRGGIGIDGKDSEADYYVISGDGQLNTFSKESAERLPVISGGYHTIQKVLRLPLLGINGLMQKHWGGPPTLLSIDVEGLELPILQSIDWKRYRPAVVCVETGRDANPAIHKLMAAQAYNVRGGTFLNTIFVDRRLL